MYCTVFSLSLLPALKNVDQIFNFVKFEIKLGLRKTCVITIGKLEKSIPYVLCQLS